jgi:hypothetical protein
LGTRSSDAWRDAEETPSATAARIAAEVAARFDENRPMPGERVDAEDSGLEASDPDAAFRGLPSWLEEESAEETARRSAERSFVRAGASVDVPLDAFSPALGDPLGDGAGEDESENAETKTKTKTSDASDLRGAVGRMRFELEAAGAAREAHLSEVRAFLDLSGRKRLGADTPPSPATAAATAARTKMHRKTSEGLITQDADGDDSEDDDARATEKSQLRRKNSSVDVENETSARRGSLGVAARSLSEPAASWEGAEDDLERAETPPIASTSSSSVGTENEGMGLALGLPPPRKTLNPVVAPTGAPASAAARLSSTSERRTDKSRDASGASEKASSRFADAERRAESRLKAQWEAFRESKANAEKRDAEAAAILRLAEREARLELDARRAEAAREAERREADLARERERRDQKEKLEARLAAQAAEHAAALEAERRKHEANLDAAARERREALDAEARRAAAAAAADAEVRLAAEAFFEADRRFEEQMVLEREARAARSAAFAADAERARRRDSAAVLADLRRETESRRARPSGAPTGHLSGHKDQELRSEASTERYIDAATGTVETVAHVAEALAARAVEATLDADVDAGDEGPQTETGPSLLRLQLRAVSTLLGAQSRKHAERLAALHARYREVDVCREAQDRLLRFAEVEDDVRAARGLARRGRGARRGKWSPPGGGVFLNSGTNSLSHNANASYAQRRGIRGESPRCPRIAVAVAAKRPRRPGSVPGQRVFQERPGRARGQAAHEGGAGGVRGGCGAGARAPRVLRQGVAQERRRAGARGARRAARRRAARAR